jgi:hypothetical protein
MGSGVKPRPVTSAASGQIRTPRSAVTKIRGGSHATTASANCGVG